MTSMKTRCRMQFVLFFLAFFSTIAYGKTILPRKWLPTMLQRGGESAKSPSFQIPVVKSIAKPHRRKNTKPKDQQQLYEAYNMLHSLAQDFHKPFDAPAVLVVGHQTSGKSALIEALMGFQFNQVGGGTKTRRPIALRMQYNASCDVPRCFLTMENGVEELKSLSDIQAYIEKENVKLERDPNRSYDSREINIRMEYRYCPNMILIDTPGMIHAPKGDQLSVQQRAIAQASKEAENLVLEKMKCQDYIILCVEDTTDWKHATTRNVVMQADPTLSRTVLVTTKLDTKLTQFSEGNDVENFIKAPLIESLFPQLYGGPFYTSVPTGRVGDGKDFMTNSDFVNAIQSAEHADENQINLKVKIKLKDTKESHQPSSLLRHVGVSKLRSYLENRVDDCYRRNVAKIVPQLQSEYRQAEEQLLVTNQAISDLSVEKLRSGANVYREAFAKELSEVIQGTAKVSPTLWGETLEEEQIKGGRFVDNNYKHNNNYYNNRHDDNKHNNEEEASSEARIGSLQSDAWKRIVQAEVGNSEHNLFGGAQYHRALREFAAAVKHMNAVDVTEEEIANAAGVGDMHDGVNFMRAACVLSLNKAQATFDPMLEALEYRCTHIMRRLFPLVDGVITDEISQKANRLAISPYSRSNSFRTVVQQIYNKFINEQMEWCLEKCKDDLRGMTRFVTWDVDGKGGSSSLYNSLPTPKSMVEIYNVAVESKAEQEEVEANALKLKQTSSLWGWRRRRKQADLAEATTALESGVGSDWKLATGRESMDARRGGGQMTPLHPQQGNQMVAGSSVEEEVSGYVDVLHLMDEMVSQRSEKRTSTVVTTLVQYIIRTWREHFAKSVAQKFNCFFLLPFIDEFPTYLRTELDKLYAHEQGRSTDTGTGTDAGGVGADLFDMSETRNNLFKVRDNLIQECDANAELQARFDKINAHLSSSGTAGNNHNHNEVQMPAAFPSSFFSNKKTRKLVS